MSTMRAMRGAILGLGVAACLASAPAFADPSAADVAAAKKLFGEVEKDEAAEHWTDAIDKLRRIVAIKETPGVRFHMGLSEERLLQLVAAEKDYRRAAELSSGSTAPDAKDVNDRATAALAALMKRVPSVTIDAPKVDGLRVTIDGVAVDANALGKPQLHDVGDAAIAASAPGHQPFAQRLTLLEGQAATVRVTLEPEKKDAPPPPAPPPPAAIEAPKPPPSRGAPWIAIGTGVGALAAGGVAVGYFVHRGSLSDAKAKACGDPTLVCDAAGRDKAVSRAGTVGLGFAIGAGVLAATTVVLLVTKHDGGGETALVVGPTGAGLAGRF